MLTVGTLSDAPPNVCITPTGQFSGFDNQLLRAIAGKLGLQVRFVGTDFAGLLAQVASRRFDVGSASIKATDERRRTVAFTNGYDFGYYSLIVPPGSAIKKFSDLAAGQRIGVVQGTVEESYVVDTLHLQPVKYPDFATVYASLKTRQIDAWVAPARQAATTMRPGDPAVIVANAFSPGNFVAYAVAKDNQPLVDALNSGLDAVDRRRHLGEPVLPVGAADACRRAGNPGPEPPRRRLCRTSPRSRRNHHHKPVGPAAPKSTLAQLRDSFFDWDMYRQAIPTLFRTGLPNTLILTSSASVIGLVLGMALAVAGISHSRVAALAGAGVHRYLPRSSRSGDHPDHRAGNRAIGGRADEQQSLPARHCRTGVDGRRLHRRNSALGYPKRRPRPAGSRPCAGVQLLGRDAAGGGAAGGPTGAAGAGQSIHRAVEGLSAGVLPGPGRRNSASCFRWAATSTRRPATCRRWWPPVSST